MFSRHRSQRSSRQATRRFQPRVEQLENRNLMASLVMGGITWGEIGSVDEQDSFTFTGDERDQIELTMTSTPTSGEFSGYAKLIAPSGLTEVGFSESSGNVAWSLQESGTYSVEVQDYYSASLGKYTIGLEGIAPISPNPVPLVMGGITSGSTSNVIEKDQFTFQGTAKGEIELTITNSPTKGEFVALARLFAPSGKEVTSFTTSSGNVKVPLPDETGKYLLEVCDYYLGATGKYTIGLEGTSPISPNPRELPRNTTLTGEISNRIEKDQLTFRGVAKETISLQLSDSPSDSGFTSLAVLFAPSGNVVTSFTQASGKVNIPLPKETGQYLLQISDYYLAARGGYEVRFEGTPLPATVAAPANLRAANVWTNTVDLNWDDKSNNETRFQISASFDGGESWVTIGQTGANARSFRVRYLEPGLKYQFRVRALSDNAASNYSNTIAVTTRLIAPTLLAASNVTDSSLDLAWLDNSNNETRFVIYRRLSGQTSWTQIGVRSANVKSFHVTGLTAGKTYQFQVRATNSIATSQMSNVVSATTLAS